MDTIQVERVEARCWVGTGSFSDVSNTDDKFPNSGWEEVGVPSSGFGNDLVGITGEIALEGGEEYSCNWMFEVSNAPSLDDNYVSNLGQPREISAESGPGKSITDYSSSDNICEEGCGSGEVVGSSSELDQLAQQVAVN